MANYSDHKKPFTNINNYLPEVYQSDVNRSVFDMAFNRHLTKDDTSRVAGFIGIGNPAALVDRQIKEPTPHRQAFQLAPTMYSKVGTVETALSFKAYEAQLELMGVDLNRMPLWGNTLQFNWVPPVNIDKLVNYQDYFWKPVDPKAPAQYFTIENRCNIATSKAQSYANVLAQKGSLFPVSQIDYAINAFELAGKYDDLFSTGFLFFTQDSTNVNLDNKFWTVTESSYDSDANTTTITVIEPIAIIQATAPVAAFVGQWWYDTTLGTLKEWNGSAWVFAVQAQSVNISLTQLGVIYQAEANCVCNQSSGWDIGAWDDNQVGNVEWSTTYFAPLTAATEAGWIAINGAPTEGSEWYDTSADILKQYDLSAASWIVAVPSFSFVLSRLTGNERWDYTAGCDAQVLNQWSEQNAWIHKSQVQSFSEVRRAQVPIFEYASTVELNEWTRFTYSWKYRQLADDVFAATTVSPARIELEPIKGFIAQSEGGKNVLYFFDKTQTVNINIDHSKTFAPGYKFRVIDDSLISEVYTVSFSEFIEVTNTAHFATVFPTTGKAFVTRVEIAETTYLSALQGGGFTNVRIEPIATSVGDTWRGYHVHWLLDTSATIAAPTSNQPYDFFLKDSLLNPPAGTLPPATPHFDDFQVFQPSGVSSITVGTNYEQMILNSPTSRIDLVDSLRYNPAAAGPYATPGTNEVRVYVDNIRQYANYTEVTGNGAPNYTLIGTTVYTSQTIPYVRAIVFDTPVAALSVVRIEVGTAAFADMGYMAVPVRTIEDETAFTLAAVAGTQPVYQSLTKYQHLEQVKTQVNQYPIFNVYDVITSEVVEANQIFGFHEDPSASINGSVQRRIVASADLKEYEFEQYLLDRDDNLLYGYRNTSTPVTFWYSPLLNTVKYFDGTGWTADIVRTTVNGPAVRRAVIAPSQPLNLLTVDQALWYDTVHKKLFARSTGSASWVEITDVITDGTDPSLRTIWRHGLNNEQYVPEYVDKDRNPITVGDVNGDWEVVDQWQFNPEHRNHKLIKFSELITHFRGILAAQPKLPGLLAGGIYSLTQDAYNYGLGGTIKEHNDSYDTLISAVNVTNTTPLGVIDFAQDEYASNLLFIRDAFVKAVPQLFTNYTKPALINIGDFVADTVITAYEDNDFSAQIYGDTTAFDELTGLGVRNFISTIPMFGLGPRFRPNLIVNGSFVQLFHHDGHRSNIEFTPGQMDSLSRVIIRQPDTRISGGTFGKTGSAVSPATESDFLTTFGSALRTGVYWYRVGGGARNLYRFAAYDIAPADPSLYDVTGAELPDGTYYYNTISDNAFVKQGLAWVAATVAGSHDISPMWVTVDFTVILANLLLDVEQKLYDVTPVLDQAFDYSTLTASVSDAALYAQLLEARFFTYIESHSITAPLVNVSYTPTNPLTWNYVSSVIATPPRPGPTPDMAGAWQELYTRWYGTPYPQLEPWKLQGYPDKPTWWDTMYLAPVGSGRRWIYNHATHAGMWENIRQGRVPVGFDLPNGVLSTFAPGQVQTYTYFSVNISDAVINGGYAPDALLPPYYDNTAYVLDPELRSLFTDYASEIIAPDADYVFGDVGPIEWQWSVSAQSPYDNPAIAFIMQPVRFMHYAFGPKFTLVDQLQVETLFHQVYAHEDALFHGDLYDTNKTYSMRGLNQWYVNFNRYSGYDTNGEFRELWAGWDPQLTYQFAGIIDTGTFEIANKYFDVIDQDYEILLVNNGVFKDMWVDAFEISLINIPPPLIQYNNQAQWKLEIDTLAEVSRPITYYGVKAYPFVTDRTTDEATAFRYSIISASTSSRKFNVAGDQTSIFTNGITFVISGSTGNDGTYTVDSSVFETSTNRTRINVLEVVPSSTGDGLIDVSGFTLPWLTGDVVVLSSTKFLPSPLMPNTPYWVIRTGTRTFQFADSLSNANDGVFIDLTTQGEGAFQVAQVAASFNVFGGAGNTGELWFHYELDRTDIRTFTPPYTILGMQTLINIIDGYGAYQQDQGILQNVSDSGDFDTDTGRFINWQLETERFMNWAFGLRQSRMRFGDSYAVTTDDTTDFVTFTGSVPQWISGTAVTLTTTGTLPVPLIAGTPYYVVKTANPAVFRLSVSANASDTGSWVDFTTQGSGNISISLYDKQRAFPRFEMNPTRNNVWLDTPLGVLSNVIEGPYSDIRVQQTIFDQYNRPLGADKLTVYREDLRSHIAVRAQLPNDIDPIYKDDPYNYIHIGGAHVFVEGFEHFAIFNDYTVDESLIYDPFLGLKTSKFSVDYFEKEDYTLRPTLGGYYLIDGKFARNLDGSATDMQNYYDTLALSEQSLVAKRSRGLLGYTGKSEFLDLLNINSKSQFLFYKGMIQTKGSVNSVKAFINSRRFVDAKLDEFWAWKIAEFGDARVRVYPEIKMFSTDSIVDDVRLEFLANSELDSDPDVVDAVSKGFQLVSFRDDKRWNIFPEQKQEIKSPLFLDAESTSLTLIYSGPTAPPAGAEVTINFWFNTGDQQAYVFNGTSWVVDTSGRLTVQAVMAGSPALLQTSVYFRHAQICDDVRVLRRTLTQTVDGPDFNTYETEFFTPGSGTTEYTKVNSEVVRFNLAGFVDVLMIFTINPAKTKLSPAKLIDNKANVVVQTMPMWDPARGYHSPVAIHNIDLIHAGDPARYSATSNPDDNSLNFWNQAESGKTWLDTSHLGYLPYYDDQIYTNVNDRLYNWGHLAPWASVETFQWVQSIAPPSEWDAQVTSQAQDTSIAQNDKATGTPRLTTFKRVRDDAVATIDPTTDTITTTLPVVAGDLVIISTAGQVPGGLDLSTKYSVSGPSPFQLIDQDTGSVIDITDSGSGVITVTPAFTALQWERQELVRDRVLAPYLIDAIQAHSAVGTITYPYAAPLSQVFWTPSNYAAWTTGTVPGADLVDVYVNGILRDSGLSIVEVSPTEFYVVVAGPFVINEYDIIDIVRPIHTVTQAETDFNPDLDDDGSTLVQWKTDYEYSTNTFTTGGTNTGSVSTTYYYFWVSGSTTHSTTKSSPVSMFEAAQQIGTIPTPYFVVQKPKDDPYLVEKYGYGLIPYGSIWSLGSLSEQFYQVPVLYREAIIRKVASYLNDDDRYIVRFNRNFTLRDDIRANGKQMNLKDKHEEWFMFRREQTSTIPQELWKRLTEAVVGYYVDTTGTQIRVPALDRELYDAQYGTDTRFGLGVDQAFCDKTLGLATILSYLQDPNNDFSPTDIDSFFATNKFDTPANIKSSMDNIYNTFNAIHVNAMWFETLSDALSTRAKYKELLKTSWIALHGIRVLEVGGLFDD